jgi:hypothetical protein
LVCDTVQLTVRHAPVSQLGQLRWEVDALAQPSHFRVPEVPRVHLLDGSVVKGQVLGKELR